MCISFEKEKAVSKTVILTDMEFRITLNIAGSRVPLDDRRKVPNPQEG